MVSFVDSCVILLIGVAANATIIDAFQLIAVGPHRFTPATPFLGETAVILHCHSGEDGSESKTECDYNEQSDEVKNVEKSSSKELENSSNNMKDAVENDSFERSLNDLSDSMNHGFDRLERSLNDLSDAMNDLSDSMNHGFDRIERSLNDLSDATNHGFDRLEKSLNDLSDKLDKNV